MSAEFCDTNVFVYAYDRSAGTRRDQARRLLERLWTTGDGVVSVQLLQELYVTLTRKASPPVAPPEARALVQDIATWTAPCQECAHRQRVPVLAASESWRH